MRYLALSPVLSAVWARPCDKFQERSSETGCDDFLSVVGKELGKESEPLTRCLPATPPRRGDWITG
jgi:hypothetical protein